MVRHLVRRSGESRKVVSSRGIDHFTSGWSRVDHLAGGQAGGLAAGPQQPRRRPPVQQPLGEVVDEQVEAHPVLAAATSRATGR